MFIQQDLHVHTNLSLCASRETTLKSYLEKLHENSISAVAVTNHYWEPGVPGAIDWYKQQNFEHIREIRSEIAEMKDCGVRFLFGAESEYCYSLRRPAITEETASQLDFLLVPNSHTHITMPKEFRMDYQKHADYMLMAFDDIINDPVSKYISAIPHPFAAVCCPYDNRLLLPLISDKQFAERFDRCAEKEIAIEINTSCFTGSSIESLENDAFLRMFQIAKKSGCLFTFGSDSHNPNDLDSFAKGYIVAEMLDLKDENILKI